MSGKNNGGIDRQSFGKIQEVVAMPNLLEVQIESYRSFLQLETHPNKRQRRGLHLVFESIFPISDAQNIFTLEYVDYSIGNPRYSVEECRERGMTFAAPLRATLRLVTRDKDSPEKPVKDVVEQSVFLGELPLMTEQGTFVINGAERVVVSQLHRSPGVFFDETMHPNGKRLFFRPHPAFQGAVARIQYGHKRHHVCPYRPPPQAAGNSTSEGTRVFQEWGGSVPFSRRGARGDSGKTTIGYYLGGEDLVNSDTGEVIAEGYEEVTEETLVALKENGFNAVNLLAGPDANDPESS